MARESAADKRWREEEIQKYLRAIERDPNNSGAHAGLAEKYLESGQREAAIHEFRTAISLSPQGPQTARWKAKLKSALQEESGVDKLNFTVCDRCQADLPTGSRTCPRCGEVLQMNFFEWLSQPENYKDVGRQTVLVTMIVVILWATFSSLSLEWKACVMCATVIVGGYYFLRAFNGDRY